MKTMVNGKEVKVLGKKEIGFEFTQKVNEFLQEGFIFNFADSTRGTQGEEMRVNLTNDGGKTVYVIYIKRFSAADIYFNKYGMELVVKKYEEADKTDTLWQSEGETVFEKKFYCIADGYSKFAYVENVDDFIAITKISRKRRNEACMSDDYQHTLSEKVNGTALKLLKRIRGYGRTKLSDISEVKRRNGRYYVILKNEKYIEIGR